MFIREVNPQMREFQAAFEEVYFNWPGFWYAGVEYEDGSMCFLIGA